MDEGDLEVVATFIAWPGWEAKLDGAPVDIRSEEDQFMRVRCDNVGKLVLEFSPYSSLYVAASEVSSLLFMCVASKNRKRRPLT